MSRLKERIENLTTSLISTMMRSMLTTEMLY